MKTLTRTALPRIVLASSSPRRIELLTRLQLNPLVHSPDVDEKPLKGESPAALVRRLSRLKAEAVALKLAAELPHALVIAADTIVVSPDGKRILGKPDSPADAARMLKQIAGRKHTVLTAYTILRQGGSAQPRRAAHLTRVVRSSVWIRKLTNETIRAYVATGEPLDKAGSYAAQGIGMSFIERISGSYTNVVGLPASQLISDLEGVFRFPVLSRLSGESVEKAAAKVLFA